MDNKNIKIVLIEDEVFIQDLYRRMLEKVGYTVLTAFDGDAGLQVIRGNPDASLVFLDIMLPKIHGIDVLRILKNDEHVKHIPVVLLSNLGEESIINEAMAHGARDYIKKVYISPQQLGECVKEYLSNPAYHFTYQMQKVK